MLGTALIVFREVLEAALIIGIVLSATRGVATRTRFVLGGIGAGLVGAGLVAWSADFLAQAAQGMGPEIFNASVLLIAAAMLTWHNLWMAQHGRELAAEMNKVGQAVSQGHRPMVALSIVIALAVLREGAEVVLFVYGIAAGGDGFSTLLVGGLIGIGAGVAVGLALYLGLLRIPTRHLFTVTTWLLILLTAGMTAAAANYLVQASVLPALSPMLWDSSSILPDKSLAGQMLHTLVGYSDRPTGMQALVYALTLVTLAILTRVARNADAARGASVLTALVMAVMIVALFKATPAQASHKIYYPTVETGETELEFRAHRDFDKDPALDGGLVYKTGVGHGFTDFWFTEFYVESVREPGSNSYVAEAYEWENLFRLTEPGKYWADFGVIVEYAHARKSADANELEVIPIIQKQLGRHLVTLNIPFSYETGNGGDYTWRQEYAIQVKHLGNPKLQLGIEAYGKLGEVNDWLPRAQQEHQIGPSLFGKVRMGAHQALKYQVGLLFGLTEASPQKTLITNLEFEF